MAALTGMALSDSLPSTRDALHRLAEHVLAAARYAATGHIGLVPAPGGFATPAYGSPPFGAESTVLAVDLAEPEEIARAVVWLASAEASDVTGTVLTVDGGYLAR